MSNFTVNGKFITKPPSVITEAIREKLEGLKYFEGVGAGKKYEIQRVTPSQITYVGSQRSSGQSESFSLNEMEIAIEIMKKLPVFNTDNVLLKEQIPSSLYQKRTPFFGILLQAEVIVEVAP
jgi:hypothetical protein